MASPKQQRGTGVRGTPQPRSHTQRLPGATQLNSGRLSRSPESQHLKRKKKKRIRAVSSMEFISNVALEIGGRGQEKIVRVRIMSGLFPRDDMTCP